MADQVAFLGPAGTYSEQALIEYAPAAVRMPFGSEREVILAVARKEVARGIVPVENSIEGAVNATLDTLAGEQLEVTIEAEIVLPIELCLVGWAERLHEVERVVSHPQPLGQCTRYLAANLPRAIPVPASSTADAVMRIAGNGQDEQEVAIGARRAAEHYGVPIIAAGIEDEHGNATRFIVVTGEPPQDVPQDVPHKTSVVFQGSGDDAPGWLVRCLSELADREVNLTKIESRPRKGQLGHYLFIADLEGSTADPRVQAAIAGLGTHCESVRVLGSYPAARQG